MSRFLTFLTITFLLSVPVASAQLYNPPISGDMVKLVPYDNPQTLPKIMLSSADKGLTYLSEYRNKLVVLNIWATWCPPCVEELPSLNALQYAMGNDKFAVVTVSIDTTGLEAVKKYLDDNNLKALPAYMDGNEDIRKLEILKGVPGVPVTLLIDPQYRVLARVEGNVDWNGPAARAVLEYYMEHATYSKF